MPSRFTIVSIGETLVDADSEEQSPIGMPLRTAIFAHQLASAVGGRAVLVTRVGADDFGRRLLDELRRRQMSTQFVQIDPQRDTGRVYTTVSGNETKVEIARDVAWEAMRHSADMEDLAPRCQAVWFDTLAQRSKQSRTAVTRFLESAGDAIKLYDANLCEGCYDERIIRSSCELAHIVKVNQEELPEVTGLLGLSTILSAKRPEHFEHMATALFARFQLRMVVLTRGERGTVLYTRRRRIELPPVQLPAEENADDGGASNVTSAAILVGMVLGWPKEKTLQLANQLGAFVASQASPTPDIPEPLLQAVRDNGAGPKVRL
jgi:fructokinase